MWTTHILAQANIILRFWGIRGEIYFRIKDLFPLSSYGINIISRPMKKYKMKYYHSFGNFFGTCWTLFCKHHILRASQASGALPGERARHFTSICAILSSGVALRPDL